MKAILYKADKEKEWNAFVELSKNGTFLFNRRFMEYHADRFTDCSLIFEDEKGRICGLLPANFDAESKKIVSHGGLTYGGLIVDERATQSSVNEMMKEIANFFAKNYDASILIYKPTPYIYHTIPAQEDLYAAFQMGAKLAARAVSSALILSNHPHLREGRRNGVVRATKEGLKVEEITDVEASEYAAFHGVLSDVLKKRHNVKPVHSLEEMRLLSARFPDNIRLFVTKRGSEILAGSWVFISKNVVHTQYLAATEEGKHLGAEDLLIDYLISKRFEGLRYFDFGISTEHGGTYLNEGLIFEKEGFGARSVCYDTYEMDLKR